MYLIILILFYMYLITEDKSGTNDNSNYAIVDSLWTFQYCVYFAVDTKSCVLSNAFTRVDGLYQQKHHSNLYEDFIWMKYILIWVYVWAMFRVDDFPVVTFAHARLLYNSLVHCCKLHLICTVLSYLTDGVIYSKT